MTFEATQKGNPRNITVGQHTFPKRSIDRFADGKGFVQVTRKASQKVFKAKPTNGLFCAQRVWNQQAETGFMREIEDEFQAFANEVLSGCMEKLGSTESELITKFYCLWNIRFLRKTHRVADQNLAEYGALDVSLKFTKDDQERLEVEGVNFIRPDLSLPSRHLVSTSIKLEVNRIAGTMRGFPWQVVVATDGEFIAPDNYLQHLILPLSPTMILRVADAKSHRMLGRDQVAAINQIAVAASIEYYFARDLSKCPVVPSSV